MVTTPLHELSEPNQKIVSGILDMYEAAWADGIPDIDNYVYGVTPDALPTLLMLLAELETIQTTNHGLFPQVVACATTPELKKAVAEGRMSLEFMLTSLLPTMRQIEDELGVCGELSTLTHRGKEIVIR